MLETTSSQTWDANGRKYPKWAPDAHNPSTDLPQRIVWIHAMSGHHSASEPSLAQRSYRRLRTGEDEFRKRKFGGTYQTIQRSDTGPPIAMLRNIGTGPCHETKSLRTSGGVLSLGRRTSETRVETS